MFRHTSRRLATASSLGSTTSSPLRTAPLALLPPIPLYRRLLRAHRKYLPQEMRLLGDEYIKAEFRAHRDTDNPVHIVGFLTEWQLYAQKVEGNNWRGDKMEEGKVGKMSDEQIGQMYELMLAIRQQELEENDPEYKPHTPPPPPEKE
ncbi:Succinate dehydrogenase assembly factor 3, mitochondrial [Recurvomyces mirabilis]|uniref:Succinate dehydrogenase assembly factor 3, mitochondrial n=1 Tax=Recurvomyces mirabilis TaxID=574656 RepID=UPI002DE0B5A9|nr:Succinate dehydrogenase assembly factor 3, mitochondrial [Recurvomyces mirabilis]